MLNVFRWSCMHFCVCDAAVRCDRQCAGYMYNNVCCDWHSPRDSLCGLTGLATNRFWVWFPTRCAVDYGPGKPLITHKHTRSCTAVTSEWVECNQAVYCDTGGALTLCRWLHHTGYASSYTAQRRKMGRWAPMHMVLAPLPFLLIVWSSKVL